MTEGCTLTVNSEHGIKYCSMEMVKCDLLERKEKITRMSDTQLRTKLELMLREEEIRVAVKMGTMENVRRLKFSDRGCLG